jgi:hypothetical protein
LNRGRDAAFAADACERLDAAWVTPGEGETASPDDVRNFWDLKPTHGEIVHPEGGLAAYGDILPIQLTAPKWSKVPLFRKLDFDPGRGHVTGIAFVDVTALAGVTIRFDFGCDTAMTTDNPEEPSRSSWKPEPTSPKVSSTCRTRSPDRRKRFARRNRSSSW